MKATLIVYLMSFLMLFFSACNNIDDKYVAIEGKVLDSLYKLHSGKIDKFFKGIEWLSDDKELSRELILLDSADDFFNTENSWVSNLKIFSTDSIELTTSNVVLANNKTNFNRWGKDDSLVLHAKTPYFLSAFSSDSRLAKVLPMDFIIKYWYYYNHPGYFKEILASERALNLRDKEELINRELESLNNIDSIKYVIVLFDLALQNPRMVASDHFESGMLITIAKIYDIKTQKLLCQDILYTENSEEISDPFGKIHDEKMKNMMVLQNLCTSRGVNIIDRLKIGPSEQKNQ